jgi:hypothetical protein
MKIKSKSSQVRHRFKKRCIVIYNYMLKNKNVRFLSRKRLDYQQSNTYNLWRLLIIGKTSQHVLLLDKEQQRYRLKMCGGMKWIVVRRAENLSGEPDRRLMREMRDTKASTEQIGASSDTKRRPCTQSWAQLATIRLFDNIFIDRFGSIIFCRSKGEVV